jgi:hypothetical protein
VDEVRSATGEVSAEMANFLKMSRDDGRKLEIAPILGLRGDLPPSVDQKMRSFLPDTK